MKILFILTYFGFAPAVAITAQATGATAATDTGMGLWLTGATVMTLAGLLYKTMRDNQSRLEKQVAEKDSQLKVAADEIRDLYRELLQTTNVVALSTNTVGRMVNDRSNRGMDQQ